MPRVARDGDVAGCGASLISGAIKTFVNGKPVVRKGDGSDHGGPVTAPRSYGTNGFVYIGAPAATPRTMRAAASRQPQPIAIWDAAGYFLGTDNDHGEGVPLNSGHDLPEEREGYCPQRVGGANGHWEYVETHIGLKGYVNGVATEIKAHGALPDGFTEEFVDPRTPAEIRTEEIRARLAELDRLKVEPMSAKLAGMATPEDEAKLAELVTETKTLRTELASLTAPTTGE